MRDFVLGSFCFSIFLAVLLLLNVIGKLLDCSQPSIFSYFYSIVELVGRIVRELYASAKRET